MKKRIALLLLTSLCLMNAMPSFAAQSAKVSVVGSTGAEYAALPNGETLKKDVGFKPKTVAALAGGYQFEEGHLLLYNKAGIHQGIDIGPVCKLSDDVLNIIGT